jgi:hypothetical protein
MGHPLYVYTPRSAASVAKQRASFMRTLGIPEGHVRIYGEHIPDVHAEPLRYWAAWLAWKLGRTEAESFVREEKAANYSNIAWLREQWLHKRDCSAARELLRSVREACYAAN